MATFKIYCSWQVGKVVEIDAETAEEAVQKAHDVDTDDGEYVDSSFEAFALEDSEREA